MLSTINTADPFAVKDTGQAISRIQTLHLNGTWTALSLDVKDMHPSTDVPTTFNIIRRKVEQQGLIEFESKAMMSISQFLELLRLYLQTMVVEHLGSYFQQIKGFPIGTRISPCATELFLEQVDLRIADNLKEHRKWFPPHFALCGRLSYHPQEIPG